MDEASAALLDRIGRETAERDWLVKRVFPHIRKLCRSRGVSLTEIDLQQTLRDKIGKDMERYVIVGACNPQLAYKALQGESFIGLLLPCNVVVRQDDGGTVHLEMMDPAAVLELVGNPDVNDLAVEVRSRLQRVLAAVS